MEMIASENFVSEAVLEAQGSVMTNKYAEGYPGRRYYGGCEFVDIVERLAIERCKKLFGAEYVNVQPHAGVQANMAVYFALLKPGDTVLDPMMGSGTVLVEACLMGIKSIGIDASPFCRFMTQTKIDVLTMSLARAKATLTNYEEVYVYFQKKVVFLLIQLFLLIIKKQTII